MQWWGWMVIGALLLATEMFVVDAQFYLVFLGVAAAVVGLAGLIGLALPEWLQWLAFAFLSVMAMMGFRQRIYQKFRRAPGRMDEPLRTGGRVTLSTRLEPGESTRVDYRGSTWTARNIDREALIDEVEIVHIEGLTLHVRRLGS
jgi:membrane protein implicated in regulation of membrane protease activity